MSSRKWIWAVVVILIILLGLWYFGIFNGGAAAPAQSATVNTAANSGAMASQNTAIKTDVATLDAQIATLNTSMSTAAAPTKPQISAIAANFKAVVATYAKIFIELRSAAINTQTSGASVAGIQNALSDLNAQLSNLTSLVGSAAKNTMATSSTAATVSASFKQMQAAQAYNTAARADVQTAVQTLGIK